MKLLSSALILFLAQFLNSCSTPDQKVYPQLVENARIKSPVNIVFYNVENLFDTIDAKGVNDNEYLPKNKRNWNAKKYLLKGKNLSRAIKSIDDWTGPDILGLCEVENREVVSDLVNNIDLKKKSFRILHKNSPDPRGIDVCMIYNAKRIQLLQSEFLKVRNNAIRLFNTRDIVYAKVVADKKDTINLYLNHWPSRRGGVAKSRPKRNFAAEVLIRHVDSLLDHQHNAQVVIMGDFNAHIGEDDAKFTYHERTNKNGQLLLDLAMECNMLILNTKFQKKKGKMWTYLSDMSGQKTQVDYILINKKWSNSVKDIEAYNTYASLGSDHRSLRAKVKISLRTCQAP